MEVHFAGSYRKFSLIQRGEIIELHNHKTGHVKDFMKISGDILHPYLISIGHLNENKKIKAYITRKWNLFGRKTLYGTLEKTLSEFLSQMSKGIRDYKLDDLL